MGHTNTIVSHGYIGVFIVLYQRLCRNETLCIIVSAAISINDAVYFHKLYYCCGKNEWDVNV